MTRSSTAALCLSTCWTPGQIGGLPGKKGSDREADSMTIEDSRTIDIISMEKEGTCILTISDHLDWAETEGHIKLLQNKLNDYLAFIESGEIYEQYPKAKDRPIRLRVMFQHAPDQKAK